MEKRKERRGRGEGGAARTWAAPALGSRVGLGARLHGLSRCHRRRRREQTPQPPGRDPEPRAQGRGGGPRGRGLAGAPDTAQPAVRRRPEALPAQRPRAGGRAGAGRTRERIPGHAQGRRSYSELEVTPTGSGKIPWSGSASFLESAARGDPSAPLVRAQWWGKRRTGMDTSSRPGPSKRAGTLTPLRTGAPTSASTLTPFPLPSPAPWPLAPQNCVRTAGGKPRLPYAKWGTLISPLSRSLHQARTREPLRRPGSVAPARAEDLLSPPLVLPSWPRTPRAASHDPHHSGPCSRLRVGNADFPSRRRERWKPRGLISLIQAFIQGTSKCPRWWFSHLCRSQPKKKWKHTWESGRPSTCRKVLLGDS